MRYPIVGNGENRIGIILYNDSMYVYKGGTATSTTVNSGGNMYVSSGGTANYNTVNSGGNLSVHCGGTANSTNVYYDGLMYVYSGGTANYTTVNSGGRMYVSRGGTATSTTVNSDGQMCVASGGTALGIVESGGYVFIETGANVAFIPNTFSGQVNYATVHAGTTAVSTTVNSGGRMYVSRGGKANSTTVNSSGYLVVYSGGTANSTTVNSSGYLVVSNGGTATSTTVNSSGYLVVSSGGTATSTTVNSGGWLRVSSGGTANNVSILVGGQLGGFSFAEDKHFDTIDDGSAAISENVIVVGVTLRVYSGGTATGTTVNEYGWMSVSSGGTANYTTVNTGGKLSVDSGRLGIDRGGTANYTTVNSGGRMYVSRGGTANFTTLNGYLHVSSGGITNSTILNTGGNLWVESSGVANITTVNTGGNLWVESSGVANRTTVNSGGNLSVSSGGTALRIVENGGCVEIEKGANVSFIPNTFSGLVEYATVHSGTTAVNTTVNSGGSMNVFSDGKITGLFQISNGATVSISRGGIVEFDVSNESANMFPLVNNLSAIGGSPNYTIKVSSDQTEGTYVLAGGASNFTGTFSIGSSEIDYGTITVNGNALSYGEHRYLLVNSDGNLILNIEPPDTQKPTLNGAPMANVDARSVTITWSAASDNIGVEGYQVKIGENTYFAPGTSYSLSSLATGTYTYQVRAYDAAGNFSDWTESKSFQILPDTDAPIMKGESSVHFDGRSATITWEEANDNVGVAGYQVKIGENIYSTIRTSYSLAISEPWALTCQIRAYDSANNYSDWSSPSNLILDGANATIYSGTTANNTSVNGGILHISSGGTANGTLLRYNGGRLYVSSGGFVNNTWILGDGPDENTVYPGGTMVVFSGGTASNTWIRPNGRLFISSGGKITGKLDISSDTNISAYSGSIIDFDISGLTTNNTALINNFSLVRGTPNYTITVSASQNMGTYILAEGGTPAYFGTTVIGTKAKDYGTLSINQTLTYGDYNYTLTYLNSKMVLIVDENKVQKPSIISTAANITTLTNQNVIVTATFSADSVQKQYRLSDDVWQNYTDGIVFERNGEVYFRSIDAAGNISDVISYAVTNIDKVAPTKPIASANITAPTNQNVTVSATFSEDSTTRQYSYDGDTWNTYNSGVVMSANGTVHFRGIDAADNISDVTEYNVTNIDKIKPAKPTAAADISAATNKDVTVSAVFSGDSAQKQYSIDNRNWSAYTSGVVMSANGKVYFRGIDAAGNISDVASYQVTNIDKVAPTAPAASANITEKTKQNVTVTATFSNDSVTKQYSLDNRNWKAYTSGIVMKANGTLYFRGIDAAGNISPVASYQVKNIDKVAPVKPSATANITKLTNQNVTVTGTFSNDSVTKQYSQDNKNWKSYTTGVVMSANGKVYFRGIDAAGNISDVTEYNVTNIDKIKPAKPTASANITAATNRDVTVSAAFSSDAAQKQYSLDNKNWKTYTAGIVMQNNGTVYFRGIDAAGNISDVASYQVKNIDKTAPVAPTASANITEKTRQNVMVTANFSADSVKKQYSLDNRNWNTYTSGIVFAENGTVWFRGIDAAGNISGTTAYTVGNIESDEFEITGDQTGNQNIPLNNPGKYTLSGNFGDITGTVTVFNGGKKAGTGTLKNGVLTFNKGNPVLLDDSLETVIKVTVKKGTNTNYTATLGAQTVFDKGDTDSREAPRQLGNVAAPGKLVNDGWVGFGDKVDYLAFSLDHAANLSLDYTATDTTKFTLYNAEGKSVMKSSLKAGTALTTKAKLLEAGTYYLEVQSTNAKKGGDANYTIGVNGATAFFTKGDNSDDTMATAKDLGTITQSGNLFENWVGYGDVYDFKSITLNSAAKLKFTVNATDAAKLTVYQLNNGKLKSIGKVSVKANIPGVTKDIFVTAGTYYLAVQSTNAKKGGSADYSIAIDGNSEFFPVGDNTNDTWQAASAKEAKLAGEEITGWVGYGDAKDFIKFQLAAGDGQIQLDMNEVTANAYNSKQIKLTCLDANGKSVALSSFDGDTLVSKKPVLAGEYYLGVTCANVKKFNTSYSVTAGLLATA